MPPAAPGGPQKLTRRFIWWVIRVSFFIDGFNVYHSVQACLDAGTISSGKWFDYGGYCGQLLTRNVRFFGDDASVVKVRLYTAIATYKQRSDADSIARHLKFNKALKSTGVEIVLGNFVEGGATCRGSCGELYKKFEEKKTDINLAMGVLTAFIEDEADCAVIISGDTDQLSTIEHAKKLFPTKKLAVAFPAHRHNRELESASHFSMKITAQDYEFNPLPTTVTALDGKSLHKPASW